MSEQEISKEEVRTLIEEVFKAIPQFQSMRSETPIGQAVTFTVKSKAIGSLGMLCICPLEPLADDLLRRDRDAALMVLTGIVFSLSRGMQIGIEEVAEESMLAVVETIGHLDFARSGGKQENRAAEVGEQISSQRKIRRQPLGSAGKSGPDKVITIERIIAALYFLKINEKKTRAEATALNVAHQLDCKPNAVYTALRDGNKTLEQLLSEQWPQVSD